MCAATAYVAAIAARKSAVRATSSHWRLTVTRNWIADIPKAKPMMPTSSIRIGITAGRNSGRRIQVRFGSTRKKAATKPGIAIATAVVVRVVIANTLAISAEAPNSR